VIIDAIYVDPDSNKVLNVALLRKCLPTFVLSAAQLHLWSALFIKVAVL